MGGQEATQIKTGFLSYFSSITMSAHLNIGFDSDSGGRGSGGGGGGGRGRGGGRDSGVDTAQV